MPRLIGPGFLTALAVALLLALGGSQAFASHVQCGDVITLDTTLDSDVVDCPGDGIVIGADGVTLDLDGHTVDGDGDPGGLLGCDTGIVNGRWDPCHEFPGEDGHDGVTVKDGAVREFAFGAQVLGADEVRLRRLRVSGSTSFAGFVLGRLSNSLIEDNWSVDNPQPGSIGMSFYGPTGPNSIVGNVTARNSSVGIEIVSAKQPTRIEDNTSFGNSDGIHMSSSRGNLLRGNRAFANDTEGMDLSDGVFENVVEGNLAWDNGIAGISMGEGAHRNRVVGNTVSRNALSPYAHQFFSGGIVLWDGEDNLFLRNRAFENGGSGGIVISSASGMLISGNRVSRNGADGIHVDQEWHGSETEIRTSEVRGNRTDLNGDDGIDVQSEKVVLAANRARYNVDLGIEAVAGVTDGGGNRAMRNGDPLQCLNVVCR